MCPDEVLHAETARRERSPYQAVLSTDDNNNVLSSQNEANVALLYWLYSK